MVVVIAAQVVIATLLVVVSTFLTHLLHDEIPSTLRAGVASGVGTVTWVVFLPFAVLFGSTAQRSGVHTAAWLLVGIAVLMSASLIAVAARRHARPRGVATAEAAPVELVEPCPAAT